MVAVDWPTGPRHQLPRTTPPFIYETVPSYVARLAHANHLQPGELRRYLTERRANHPRPDWLATVSGYPVPVLQSRLKGFAENERNLTRQRAHSRPACRFCMARRSVDEPVYCWLPEHVTVCYRHRRWIGPPAHVGRPTQSRRQTRRSRRGAPPRPTAKHPRHNRIRPSRRPTHTRRVGAPPAPQPRTGCSARGRGGLYRRLPADHHPGRNPGRLSPPHLDKCDRENPTSTDDQRPASSDHRSPAKPRLTVADASHRHLGG
jgi:TniQ protein